VYGFQNAALRGQKLVILPGEVESQVLKEVPLPGTTLRLDHIPPTDPVCNYLRSRGLDPVFLGETFDLSYCLDASRDYPMTNGRIVIPIVMKGMLVGWQCRYVGDIDWKARNIPKYYNLPNMPRRLMLYNFDKAKKFPYVVITEGPADAWSVGEPAIATFGKHVSTPQTQLIAETWPQTIIILLDGDAWKDAEELVERFKQGQYKGTIVPVRLPPEKDPGALDHSYLWECIYQECEKAGVDLQSLKRDDNDTNHIPRSRYRSPARVDDTRGPMEQQPVPEYSFDQPRNA
jgi:hypothetical protein